ncbi:helix-turn-helix domain-containing protein [Gracilibacillus oryzae]|uniref:Helix-turn-helix domain-containing protein n=1 Tax=Gracilibacillus oryzae TaxID=1672701 RepID=A0A7C8KQ02_9BACI|nr:helix-turn-helix domain-containing protein [Gracilibacillus oryzae]KAB8127043.1 helix-turn-helix domain-containing protein [Gracilibacillus oryzae]
MKKFPLTIQLTIIMYCLLLVPVMLLSWYSSAQIFRNAENAIADSSLAELNANRKLTENAMNNVARNTVTLASSDVFDSIRSYHSYSEINSHFSYITNALAVLRELSSLNRMEDGVYSSFFYLNDSDYVLSTDKGVTLLDRYDSIDWIEEAIAGRKGIIGVWYPRKLNSGVNVISYVLPLNRLSTNTRGTIVVNVKESQFEKYLSSSESGKQGYILTDSTGRIISHPDKTLLLNSDNGDQIINEILEEDKSEGYTFQEIEDERVIYSWSDSKQSGWTYISINSVNELMINTQIMRQNIIIFTTCIILIGVIMTVFLAKWLSQPARKLVGNLRLHTNLEIDKRNELDFLDEAFERMQQEEEVLQKMLSVREDDSCNLAIYNLIRGEITGQGREIFPCSCFLVVVVSIDQYGDYVSNYNPETRSYHCYMITSTFDSLFSEDVRVRSVHQGNGSFIIVINYDEPGFDFDIHSVLVSVRERAKELLNHSVTIGVSRSAEGMSVVSDLVAETMELIKQRIVEGSGGITYWKKQDEQDVRYIYPSNSERRILNFLDQGDLDNIKKELKVINKEIRSAEYIAYDNILFIYHQLVGISIKHLREKNVSTSQIFAKKINIYTDLASIDTLDELEQYLSDFFEEIVKYLTRSSTETKDYGGRILNYLDEHFDKDIVFEEMAEELGISYSYMRKIVNEMTGQSLINHINLRRIEKAKIMLIDWDRPIAQIASEVGYNNVQSFNRFFRKFEGMSPSKYKEIKARIH